METLVVVAQQDQFHNRNRGRKHGSFGYHTRGFREINCRTFQSGSGILPSPTFPKTPANVKKHVHSDQNVKNTKRIAKSSSVPIRVDCCSVRGNLRDSLNDDFFYSERWAGPAYSNSPPPSSLPIPKFSIKPKRTVSLELPSVSASDIDLLTLVAKSAPPSPTREHHKSASRRDIFNRDDEFATKTLRRILNLDMADE